MRRAFILLHISIFLWGFTGIFARSIHLSEGVLVWYRMLLTATCWILIGVVAKKVPLLPLREAMRISVVGLLVALHWLFFYGSIKYSNISIGMSCLPLIAVFSSILEPVVLREKFKWHELMLALLALLGMFLIFHFSELFRTGIILGVISAVLGSIFTILNKRLVGKYNSETITTYEISSGFIYLTLLMPLYLYLFPTDKLIPDSTDWLLLFIFSIVCTVIPFNLSMKALERVSAFTANLSLNMEPVYGIFLAFIFYHEQKELNAGFFAGAGIILFSVVAFMVLRFRHHIKDWIPWVSPE
ncbi:MAG TPA: DMT family transporter [Chitinophagales bacterium]|nr:DMT family transporter [Chitinophagales bacterium]